MADVFIALTRPEIVDKDWPPKIETPVLNDAHDQASFGRAKSCVTNDVAGQIQQSSNDKAPEATVTNVESKIKPTTGAPIANADNYLGITTRGGTHRYAPRDPPKGTPIRGGDSQILPQVGAPISNEGHQAHAIIYQGPETDHARPPAALPTAPSTPISNESGVTFSTLAPAPKRRPNQENTTYEKSKIAVENSDIALAKSAGTVSNEIPSVISPMVGQLAYPQMDTRTGGGGDQTKPAGADVDITGTGQPLNV